MEEHIDIILNGLITLMGVVLGFILQLFSTKRNEKKRLMEEFAGIKNSIYSTTVVNNMFPELLKLKHFFVRNSSFVKFINNNEFYQKWLTHPLVEEAFTGAGYWTKEKVEEMFRDLDKTKL